MTPFNKTVEYVADTATDMQYTVSAASSGLAEGGQSMSDKLVLLQHLGDGPENSKPGLSVTGDTFPGKERSSIKSFARVSA